MHRVDFRVLLLVLALGLLQATTLVHVATHPYDQSGSTPCLACAGDARAAVETGVALPPPPSWAPCPPGAAPTGFRPCEALLTARPRAPPRAHA